MDHSCSDYFIHFCEENIEICKNRKSISRITGGNAGNGIYLYDFKYLLKEDCRLCSWKTVRRQFSILIVKHADVRNKLEKILQDEKNVEYLAMLDTSIAEAEKGEVVVKSIEELETYE